MKVSIITVCLNSADTIEQTIRSVLCQTYSEIEYVIVDGDSTDGTLEIINRYRDSISQLISEKDSGIYDAMNKGLRLASGDVIGLLNADDFYADKDAIERVVDALKAENADCCYGALEYIAKDNPAKIIRRWQSQPYRDGLFEKGWHPPHPTFFVRKHIYDKHGGFNLLYNISADYELMLRFLKKYGIKSCYIPHVLIKMRTGGNSNRSVWQIIRANIECYQAWKRNDLNVGPFIMLRKPVSKLLQYIRRD